MLSNWNPFRRSATGLSPEQGYRLWSENYESPDNLMQQLDRRLVEHLLQDLKLSGKTILDFGCGTGRYWPFLYQRNPRALTGCDPSPDMLGRLCEKYPGADVHQLKDHSLFFQAARSVDLLFSTLTIGHLPALTPVVNEWNRVLRPGGHFLLTGNHPEALKAGVKRSFFYQKKSYAIRNEIHELKDVRTNLEEAGWTERHFKEIKIGEEEWPYFEKNGALKSYEWIKGMPVIYGMLWEKNDPHADLQ